MICTYKTKREIIFQSLDNDIRREAAADDPKLYLLLNIKILIKVFVYTYIFFNR